MSVAPAPMFPLKAGSRDDRTREGTWRVLLALVCLAAVALVIGLGIRLNFFNDDWWFLLQRPGLESGGGLDTILAPHNANLVVLLALSFKVLAAAFGMHSQWPFRIVLALPLVALAVVVQAHVRSALGPALGLLAAAVVVFMGPAWEALLFFSGSNHLWALALGLGALLLLVRDTAARNVCACALLICAVGWSNTGLALSVGAAVAILHRHRPRQLWIAVIPAAAYALWWLGYGRSQSTGITLGHIAHLPGYVFDSLSYGLASTLGLVHGTLPSPVRTGHLVTVLAAFAFVVWLARGGRPRARALPFAATLLTFWLLTGASAIPGRGPTTSRYQLLEASLIIILAAELAHAWRPSRRGLATVVVLGLAVIASNLVVLASGYTFLRAESDVAGADTGALQIARAHTSRDLWLVAPVAGDVFLSGVTAGRYFAQSAAHQAPPFDTPAGLAHAPARARAAADGVLIAAERLHPRLVAGASGSAPCVALQTAPGGRASTQLAFGTTLIRNQTGGVLALGLSRFGPLLTSHGVAFLPGRATELLHLPSDGAAMPWRLTAIDPIARAARLVVCRA